MKHINMRHLVFAAFFLFGLALLPAPAYAQGGGNCGSPSLFFLDSWASYMCEGGEVTVNELNDFLGLAFWAVDSLLKLVVYVAAGFIIYGGVKYMMAQGDQSSIAEAKTTVTNAVIGMIIAICAVALVQFVTRAIV